MRHGALRIPCHGCFLIAFFTQTIIVEARDEPAAMPAGASEKERRDTFVETERNQTACRIDAGAACRTAGRTADHAVQVGMRIEPQLRYDPQDRCRAALHDRRAARCRKGGRMIFSYSEAILIALLIWCSGFCAGTGFMRRDIEREDE